jgi:hypothetical protein
MKPGLVIRAEHLTLHFDPDIWGPVDPNIFDPSRLLNNKSLVRYSFLLLSNFF